MLRLQQIAKYLREPLSNVTSRLVLKGSGRYFLRFQGNYYAFPSTKEVIVPYELASLYSSIFHNISIPPYSNLSAECVPQNKSLWNAKVAVLLGHFNHGKTTLLDTLINYSSQNNSNDLRTKVSREKSDSQTLSDSIAKVKLVDEEKHGITQDIRTRLIYLEPSAYPITFIDTPGQDIFYRMRNASAELADLGILVIAVDDGICQQTNECVGILEAMSIPTIVCINKVDQLSTDDETADHQIQELITKCKDFVALERASFLPISAKQNIGIKSMVTTLKNFIDKERVKSVRNSKRGKIADAIEEKCNSKSRKSPKVLGPTVSGRGVVLNIGQHSSKRQELLIILTEGKICVGDYISAGGWCGKVISMFSQFSGNSFSVSPHTFHCVSEVHATGYAVYLHVDFHSNCSTPRPLGYQINVLSTAPELQNIDRKELSNAMKRQYISQVIARCEEEMDHYQMLESFENYKLSEHELSRFRVEALFENNQNNRNCIYAHDFKGESCKSLEDPSITCEEEMLLEECESPEIQFRVIYKASNDMEISTVTDAFDDFLQTGSARPEESEFRRQPSGRIVYSGIGDVSLHDVAIAKAANGIIVCFNVSLEKHAMKECDKYNIKVLSAEKIQDIIDFVLFNKSLS